MHQIFHTNCKKAKLVQFHAIKVHWKASAVGIKRKFFFHETSTDCSVFMTTDRLLNGKWPSVTALMTVVISFVEALAYFNTYLTCSNSSCMYNVLAHMLKNLLCLFESFTLTSNHKCECASCCCCDAYEVKPITTFCHNLLDAVDLTPLTSIFWYK